MAAFEIMEQIGKLIVVLGAVLVVVGLVAWGLGRIGFKGLPGDIRVESDGFKFYFPVVTCLVISILLTVASWLWQWLRKG